MAGRSLGWDRAAERRALRWNTPPVAGVRERLQRCDGCHVLHHTVDALGELRLMQSQTMSAAKDLTPLSSPQRQELLGAVADLISELPRGQVLRVAVDGIDGAGKTTFADELASVLQERGEIVIRASVDAFHNPKAKRYERGRTSPEGFFRDSYDYEGLEEALLDPLSPGGTGRYHAAIFDHGSDLPVLTAELQAQPDSLLVFDGIFLHRPELRGYWDFSIFLDVAFNVSVPRMAVRDSASPDPASPDNRRYVEGQKLYLQECRPKQHAAITIDNSDLACPYIVTEEESDGPL